MPFRSLGLNEALLRAVEELGYTRPTPIQEQAIPQVLLGKDVVGVAQTGTGKTAAYVLPIIHRLMAHPRKHPGALILSPTRELAQQIDDDIRDLGKHTPIKGASVFGGVGFGPQREALTGGADIIVATPGRLLDHVRRGHAKFDGLQALVLDEADRMLDMGFMPDVLKILERLPKKRQTLLFSATMPPPIMSLAREYLHEPVMVQVAKPSTVAAGIQHAVYPVNQTHKQAMLIRLLSDPSVGSALVFVGMKNRAESVRFGLDIRNIPCATLHSDRTQQERNQALEAFRDGKVRVLVATDLAQRGLDVANITHVINYDVPRSAEEYVHRVGRTARAAAVGVAFTLVSMEEEAAMRSIEHALGQAIPRVTLPDFDYGIWGVPGKPPAAPLRRRRR